jgi:hypothetical protein
LQSRLEEVYVPLNVSKDAKTWVWLPLHKGPIDKDSPSDRFFWHRSTFRGNGTLFIAETNSKHDREYMITVYHEVKLDRETVRDTAVCLDPSTGEPVRHSVVCLVPSTSLSQVLVSHTCKRNPPWSYLNRLTTSFKSWSDIDGGFITRHSFNELAGCAHISKAVSLLPLGGAYAIHVDVKWNSHPVDGGNSDCWLAQPEITNTEDCSVIPLGQWTVGSNVPIQQDIISALDDCARAIDK